MVPSVVRMSGGLLAVGSYWRQEVALRAPLSRSFGTFPKTTQEHVDNPWARLRRGSR